MIKRILVLLVVVLLTIWLFLGVTKVNDIVMPAAAAVYSSYGEVNLTISPVVSLVLLNVTIDFGTFYVNSTCGVCSADTNGNQTACCVGILNVTEGFALENQGNKNLSIQINFTANASEFIGGVNASFAYRVIPDSEAEGGQVDDTIPACANQSIPRNYVEVNTSLNYICGGTSEYPLSPRNDQDNLIVDLKLIVPPNTVGQKEVTVVFTGTAS